MRGHATAHRQESRNARREQWRRTGMMTATYRGAANLGVGNCRQKEKSDYSNVYRQKPSRHFCLPARNYNM
jgi:hypothetical protein